MAKQFKLWSVWDNSQGIAPIVLLMVFRSQWNATQRFGHVKFKIIRIMIIFLFFHVVIEKINADSNSWAHEFSWISMNLDAHEFHFCYKTRWFSTILKFMRNSWARGAHEFENTLHKHKFSIAHSIFHRFFCCIRLLNHECYSGVGYMQYESYEANVCGRTNEYIRNSCCFTFKFDALCNGATVNAHRLTPATVMNRKNLQICKYIWYAYVFGS